MPEIEIPNPDEIHEKAENPFSRTVAMAVAVYAVVLAIASAGGHNCSKEMVMAKQEEANAWNRYQSKSTREALYRNEIIKLEAKKEGAGGTLPTHRQKLLDWYVKEEGRMKDDKREIAEGNKEKREKGAQDYQEEVKLMQRKDPYFDFAEVLMQLGIVLASVSMLSGKKWAFVLSIMLAVSGALLTVNGFFLLDDGKLLGGH
ncbi:MAG TPA: DUF4337 domain-containing protein [Fimbriiglobus sp.]